MIKAVISDSEVLKMIDYYSLDKSTEKPVYDLKLTRAKTKELIGLDQNAIWNIMEPYTLKKFDIEALINQEMSEDSSDEEYEPHEDVSDEDIKANENTVDEESIIDDECSESESPIKEIIQGFTNENNSDENIWQRTRSKLCLSKTPLTAIEQAFVPPDITTDMYDTHCDNQDWLNFLKEFYFDGNQLENNDDENDPEYNVMVDEETEGTDSEELRMDRAVKVTKKELNELMSELFEYTEMLSSDDEEETKDDDAGTSKSLDDAETPSTSSSTPISLNGEEAEDKKGDVCNEYYQFTEKQNRLLQQQLQQHVQLLLQSFLLSYKHPSLPDSYALECRKRIMELKIFKGSSPVVGSYNIINLEPSIQLMNKWVEYLNNQENLSSMERFMEVQLQKVVDYKKKKSVYLPELHPKLIELCLSSCAFMHPLYLPNGGFTGSCSISKGFSVYEDQLLAMGLEEFSDLLGFLPDNKENLRKIVELVCYHLVTAKPASRALIHIHSSRKSSNYNPIKKYFETFKAPEVQHFVIIQSGLKKLREYPMDFFPQAWEKYFLRSVGN
nr:GON-4-like protein isoform X2 [Halyomorpha halys]